MPAASGLRIPLAGDMAAAGAVTPHTARVWLRARRPGAYQVEYWPEQEPEQRRLSRAVWPDESCHRAGRKRMRHSGDDGRILPVALRYAIQFQRVGHFGWVVVSKRSGKAPAGRDFMRTRHQRGHAERDQPSATEGEASHVLEDPGHDEGRPPPDRVADDTPDDDEDDRRAELGREEPHPGRELSGRPQCRHQGVDTGVQQHLREQREEDDPRQRRPVRAVRHCRTVDPEGLIPIVTVPPPTSRLPVNGRLTGPSAALGLLEGGTSGHSASADGRVRVGVPPVVVAREDGDLPSAETFLSNERL